MGSAIPKAKTRPVSWNALEKIEPFTQEVKAQLEILKSRQRVKIFPNNPLSSEMLDKNLFAGRTASGRMVWIQRLGCTEGEYPVGIVERRSYGGQP